MREIKFRAWHKGRKTMVYFKPETLVKDQFQALALVTLMKDKSELLMQYTGLKDKNGKEVYEGDIDSEYFVFTYDTEMGGWYRMKSGEGYQWHCQSVIQGRLPFEIIGNIYENPEEVKS